MGANLHSQGLHLSGPGWSGDGEDGRGPAHTPGQRLPAKAFDTVRSAPGHAADHDDGDDRGHDEHGNGRALGHPNSAPVIEVDNALFSAASGSGDQVLALMSAWDPDGDTLHFAVTGDDAGSVRLDLSIDDPATDEVEFHLVLLAEARDVEGTGGDDFYSFAIEVSDGYETTVLGPEFLLITAG